MKIMLEQQCWVWIIATYLICNTTNSLDVTKYQLMDEFDVSLTETDYLLFEVKSCTEINLLFMQYKADFDIHVYEIVIGGWNNTLSAIRKGRTGAFVNYEEHQPLHCNVSQTFWITWTVRTIQVGTGSTIEQNDFLTYTDTDVLDINHVAVSPGKWTFYSSNCECCTQNQRFCQGLLNSGVTESGVYSVAIEDGVTINVYCDMETDDGGWLVFQRRQDGSENFYRNWTDYERGFGSYTGEFWLGNQHLSSIVGTGHYQLRVDLQDLDGEVAYAKYHTFIVGNRCDKYRLTVSGYSGNAGDSLAYHNGQFFTTKDMDNDSNDPINCANRYLGGWWYSRCHYTNPNGLYLQSKKTEEANGVTWQKWKGNFYSLKKIELKIREICKL